MSLGAMKASTSMLTKRSGGNFWRKSGFLPHQDAFEARFRVKGGSLSRILSKSLSNLVRPDGLDPFSGKRCLFILILSSKKANRTLYIFDGNWLYLLAAIGLAKYALQREGKVLNTLSPEGKTNFLSGSSGYKFLCLFAFRAK